MTAILGTFTMGVCVIGWVYGMEKIELPWIFTSVRMQGESGMTLRHVVASKTNMWQAS